MAGKRTVRRWEWVLAVGLFCMALGQVWGHAGGNLAAFVEGLGVGIALGASVAYLALAYVVGGRRAQSGE